MLDRHEGRTPREPRRVAPINIFLSYAHNDEVLSCELMDHLAVLERADAIRVWSARLIPPGEDRKLAVQAKLDTARIILLLVSADFLASGSCMDHETTRALERGRTEGARVIPILLRPCDWKLSSFAHLLVFPTNETAVTLWPNRDQAWAHVATEIRRVVEDSRVASANHHESDPPHFSSGINPFEYGPSVPSDRFAGRRAQREDVRSRLGGIAAQSISLVGLARTGKSSMFRYIAERVHEFCPSEQTPLVVSLDLESKVFHSPEGILEGLRLGILKRTGESPWPKDQSHDDFVVRDGLEALRDRGTRLIVLLDGFERISARLERFQNWGEDWRSKASAGYFALGIATRRPLVDVYTHCGLTSPFGNIFSTTRLGAFLVEEWTALVRARFSKGGARVSESDLALIDELAGGLPLYVQMAAALLWQHRTHEKTRAEFRLQSDDRFRELWLSLSAPERHALRHASGVTGRIAPEAAVVGDMIRYGVLRSDGRVFSSVFADFVRAQP